jgi:hypothetical protein
VGDIIMSDRASDGSGSTTNPDGYLRKVESVSCDSKGVHVKTTNATVGDAFKNLKLDVGLNVPACKGKGTSLGIEYGGKLYEGTEVAKTAAGVSVPVSASIGMDLSLCFMPKLTLKADHQGFTLNSLEVSATGTFDAAARLTASMKLDPSVTPQVRAELAGKTLKKTFTTSLTDRKVPLGSVNAGPVSMPISLKYTALLACDFAFTAPVEMEVGATASATLTAGLVYTAGKGVEPKTDSSAKFQPLPPAVKNDGLLYANCTITPRIQVNMFGLATGELATRASLAIGAEQSCLGKDAQGVTQRKVQGEVEAGISASALAKVDLFGLVKWKKECTLFSETGSVAYDRTSPTPGGAGAACTAIGALPLPPKPVVNLAGCFDSDSSKKPIDGTCTHDVCTAGERLGQQCDECTKKLCDLDSYCCDTYWGPSCFASVEKICGKKCGQ